jgi:nitroreductase
MRRSPIVDNLKPNNQTWAQVASLLIAICAVTTDDDGKPQRWAEYDAGQAVATLTTQATEMGLHVHQMAGFEVDGIRSTFELPEQLTPITVVAVGEFDPDADLPEVLAERERAPRQRLSIEELLITDPRQEN